MRLLFIALAIVLLAACTDHMKVPSDIIPKEKMEGVFWDMIQAERYATNFLNKTGDSVAVKKSTFTLYDQVFRIHGITEKEFKKSYLFYMSRPDIAYALFDSIVAHTDQGRKDIYSAITKRDSARNKNRNDSVKRKDLLNLKIKPGAFRNRRDSVIQAQLLSIRRDSSNRAQEITRRKDSAKRAEIFVRKRDSLVRRRLLNKKKAEVKSPAN